MKLTFLVCFLIITSVGYACSCIGLSSVKEAFEETQYIFHGKVLKKEMIYTRTLFKIEQDEINKLDTLSWPLTSMMSKYTFQIVTIYKGKINTDTIHIYTGIGGGDCGYDFNVGGDYLIYGSENQSFFTNYFMDKKLIGQIITTHICTRTKQFDEDEANSLIQLSK